MKWSQVILDCDLIFGRHSFFKFRHLEPTVELVERVVRFEILLVKDLGTYGRRDNHFLCEEWRGLTTAPWNGVWPFINQVEKFTELDLAAEFIDNDGFLAIVSVLPTIVVKLPKVVRFRIVSLECKMGFSNSG